MLKIIYEDHDILVAEKPAGLESQASRGYPGCPQSHPQNRPHGLWSPMSELSTDWTSLSGESWFTLRIRRRQPLLASRFRMAG